MVEGFIVIKRKYRNELLHLTLFMCNDVNDKYKLCGGEMSVLYGVDLMLLLAIAVSDNWVS